MTTTSKKMESMKCLNKYIPHNDTGVDEAELWDIYSYPFDAGTRQHGGELQGCVHRLGNIEETTGGPLHEWSSKERDTWQQGEGSEQQDDGREVEDKGGGWDGDETCQQ